jgi:hypothetical protein
MTIAPPQPSEFNEYYGRYISKVAPGGPLEMLQAQVATFHRLGHVPEQDAGARYAEGKWSVKEVIGHMADVERLFSYRLLHLARGDQAPLPGMDEKTWSAAAPHAGRRMQALTNEMISVRFATIMLVESLDESALARAGVASGFPVTARALCWMIPGHAQHHLEVLRERYRITVV